jgi:osmotically-inducible protein OsmY
VGIALAAAAGFGAGLVAGLVAGELLGDVNLQRMRHVVRRLGTESGQPRVPDEVERAVTEALAADPITQGWKIRARVIDDGLIELTGRVPVEDVRLRAGEIARQATGGDVVVNRILVREGARA